MTKWVLFGALFGLWVRVLVASANVTPPAQAEPSAAGCDCAPVPDELQKARTQIRLLKAELMVAHGQLRSCERRSKP